MVVGGFRSFHVVVTTFFFKYKTFIAGLFACFY